MTIQESTQLLSKEASVSLLADMLKQAEEEKTDLLAALKTIAEAEVSEAHDSKVTPSEAFVTWCQAVARTAIDKAKGA